MQGCVCVQTLLGALLDHGPTAEHGGGGGGSGRLPFDSAAGTGGSSMGTAGTDGDGSPRTPRLGDSIVAA
eukprot:SAG22_NODE_807_length_7081_cov_2.460756_1_plen_69_part_10